MDFFEAQERSRRRSRRLVAVYLLAVAAVVASYCAAAALLYAPWAAFVGLPPRAPGGLLAFVAVLVLAVILGVSACRIWQLRQGGHVVADLLGARYVEPGRASATERRLLNVVEEMAIASGVSVPPVYCLAHEQGINALVAGHSPNEAVIIVTRGALEKLSRDELQGVMGHEFSHILNGDMALNVRLVGLLSGLECFLDAGEAMVHAAAREAYGKAREARGLREALGAVAGVAVAFVGFPGAFAAAAIKAAISREREFLADAASVQYTRNPEAIAGALDSILALGVPTSVAAAHSPLFTHMFFAQAMGRWWGFPTHPPTAERIRRAHPRFHRDDYRQRRHGRRQQVAVLDGAGNVVKHVKSLQAGDALAMVASIGTPTVRHVDYAARLLASLPGALTRALHEPAGAEDAMFALALEPDEPVRMQELAALEAARGPEAASRARALYADVGALSREHMLELAELAAPAIKEQRQPARDAFLADLAAVVQADRRVTLREFVLLTLLRQRLREGAGQPIRTQFRKVEEVAADAHAVVSLVALAAGGGAAAAFGKGAAVLKLGWTAPLPQAELDAAKVERSLERLRHLAPLAKPGVLRACVEAVSADGSVGLAEGELVRMVAATLDCPVPPLLRG